MNYFNNPSKGPQRAYFALPAAFFVLTALSRLPFMDPMLFNLDSGNFVAALGRFDPSLNMPHPPGYFLYVMLGRISRLFITDGNTALVAVSILFSGMFISLLYVMGREIYGSREGTAAALIGLTSPLVWFHGEVALSYATEAFFSALVAWTCYRVQRGNGRMLWASAAALGVASGFRQGTALFLFPLWLYSVRREKPARIAASAVVMLAVFLAWYLPMLRASGGYEAYNAALKGQFYHSVWSGVSFSSLAENAVIQLQSIGYGLLAALVPLASRLFFRRAEHRSLTSGPASAAFFGLWVLPSLCFYLVVISTGIAPGYALVYLPALILLAGRAAVLDGDTLSERRGAASKRPGRAWAAVVAAVVAINFAAFIYMDVPFSLRGINKNNRRLGAYLKGIRENFPPENTIIIGSEHFYVSCRHLAHYLPEYVVYYTNPLGVGLDRYYLRLHGDTTKAVSDMRAPEGTRSVVSFVNLDRPLDTESAAPGERLILLEDGLALSYYDYGELLNRGLTLEEAFSGK